MDKGNILSVTLKSSTVALETDIVRPLAQRGMECLAQTALGLKQRRTANG